MTLFDFFCGCILPVPNICYDEVEGFEYTTNLLARTCYSTGATSALGSLVFKLFHPKPQLETKDTHEAPTPKYYNRQSSQPASMDKELTKTLVIA